MAQDSRIEKLWKILDTQEEGQLNVKALQRGLSKMDHRKHSALRLSRQTKYLVALKNADTLLQDVMKAVDTNGDGHIQYSGKQAFRCRKHQAALTSALRISNIH